MTLIDLVLLIAATEATVELFKKAAPLQGMREWIVQRTPWLYSERQQTHLLECPYCMSVWAGFCLTAMYLYVGGSGTLFFMASLAIHRLSTFLHLAFSLIRDKQMDIRIARRR